MTIPAILFGFLISSFYGLIFHFWRGGNGGRLFLYLIFSWIGFWVGHAIGNYFGWTFFTFGILRVGMATVGSLIALALGYFLSLIDTGEIGQ